MIYFIFDIDGVLTPKQRAIDINTKLTDQQIKEQILQAIPSKKGFQLLFAAIKMTLALNKTIKASIFFATGRKKSAYYECTLQLIEKGFTELFGEVSELPNHALALLLINNVLFYAEDGGYKDKQEYFSRKIADMTNFEKLHELKPTDQILYFDDDPIMVTQLASVPFLFPVHFEGD